MYHASGMTETQLLDWIASLPLDDPRVLVGPGDDCAILDLGGKALGVTTDALVEGIHFRKGAPPHLVGRKAACVNLSDIAAMGLSPLAIVASACLPPPLDEGYARRIVEGIREAASRHGCALVGGDLDESPRDTVISCTAVGTGDAARALLRRGAEPGDGVYVTGELGGSSLGKHTEFVPRLSEGAALAERGVRCAIDVSDGLAIDAWRLARASGVRIVLEEEEIPVSGAARELSRADGKSSVEHALEDGEDFELLFTARAGLVEGWMPEAGVTRIGRAEEGKGVALVRRGEKEEELQPRGYEHWS